jgi:hypothetical protein
MKDYFLGLAVSCLAIFAPIKEMIATAIIIILVDLVTGILAAKKKGEKITSAGIRRSITKFAVYLTAILIGFLVETYMIGGFIPVSKIAAGLIGVVETKSIFENLDVLNGSPLFKALIDKLGSVNDSKKDE